MTPEQLVKGRYYFCEWMKKSVQYCGTQVYEGKTYHNFWEAGLGLYHWLDPKDVREMEQP